MFGDVYRSKKVLITGNTGFKGSWLTLWLRELGAQLTGFSEGLVSNPSLFELATLDQIIDYNEGDIRSFETIEKVVLEVQPDFIFHLAAQAIVKESYENPVRTIATNTLGTAHLLEAVRKHLTSCKVVLITSDKCYFNKEWAWGYREHDELGGKDIYSASKAGAEIVINAFYHSFFEESNIRLASARAGNVIGGGDWAEGRIVPDCFRAWSKNETVEIRSPNATRPWQHVLEPLSGYLRLGQMLEEKKLNGSSFNFGPPTGKNESVEDLINDLFEHYENEKVIQPYSTSGHSQFEEAGLLQLNCDKAAFHLNWHPTLNFEQTVEMTSAWYQNHLSANGIADYPFTQQQLHQYIQLAEKSNQAWVH